MSTLASVIIRDLFANRPAASIAGRLFFATDTGATYRDNGSTWDSWGGGGSVTSVAMTGDGTVFNSSVTGSPITTTGTLAPSLHTQSANVVLAGPTSGGAVAPTFRSLGVSDGWFVKGFVYLNTATNSTTAGWQKVPVDTVLFDTGSIWNAANKRFIPTQAGYYQVSVRTRYNSGVTSGAVAIAKNGTQSFGVGCDHGATSTFALGGTGLILCNGTTDYIESFVFNNTSVTAFTTGNFDTWLQILGPF
jgi:hypothetical protein